MLEQAERTVVRGWLVSNAQLLREELYHHLRRELPDVTAALGIALTVLTTLAFHPEGAGSHFALRIALGLSGALAGAVMSEALKADIPRGLRAAGAFLLFLLIFFANHVGEDRNAADGHERWGAASEPAKPLGGG